MSGQNFPDNTPEGDWDDKGHLAWNEFDWNRYLKQNYEEINRFLSLYLKLREHPNRLDEIAHKLGWDREDMGGPSQEEDSPDENIDPIPQYSQEEEIDTDDFDPYTIHRHPVYIVSKGLFQHLNDGLDMLIEQNQDELSTATVHKYDRSIYIAEHNAVMAVNALDMGDFNLCICHLKNAISVLNASLAMLQELPSKENKAIAYYASDATAAIFDLRELWLRVLHECREEHKRGYNG